MCRSASLLFVATTFSMITAVHGGRARGENESGTATLQTAAPALQIEPDSPSTTHQQAPANAFPRPVARPPVYSQPFVEPQVTSQTRQALGFYGGYSARATLSQLPRRTPIRPGGSQSMRRQSKPFEVVHRDPTVSPYLNLYREEKDTEGAPNYFAFVRPQLQQLDENRMQQREITQLRGQLQGTIATPGYQTATVPGTGTPARFMDTAQFYSGWQR